VAVAQVTEDNHRRGQHDGEDRILDAEVGKTHTNVSPQRHKEHKGITNPTHDEETIVGCNAPAACPLALGISSTSSLCPSSLCGESLSSPRRVNWNTHAPKRSKS